MSDRTEKESPYADVIRVAEMRLTEAHEAFRIKDRNADIETASARHRREEADSLHAEMEQLTAQIELLKRVPAPNVEAVKEAPAPNSESFAASPETGSGCWQGVFRAASITLSRDYNGRPYYDVLLAGPGHMLNPDPEHRIRIASSRHDTFEVGRYYSVEIHPVEV
jgi:hypothetical protein